MDNKELIVQLVGGYLMISIGIETLAHAIKMSPELEEYGVITITNTKLFAEKMVKAIEREDENGTTPIHTLFDEAARYLIEYGEEGIDIEKGGA